MKLLRKSFLIFITNLFVFITLNAQSLNKAVYKPRYHDPVLEQMKEQREKDIAREDSADCSNSHATRSAPKY